MKKLYRDLLPFIVGTIPVSIVLGVYQGESFAQVCVRVVAVSGISAILLSVVVFAYWKYAMKKPWLQRN